MRPGLLLTFLLIACMGIASAAETKPTTQPTTKKVRATQQAHPTPKSGKVEAGTKVLLSCGTPGSVIRYTLDGSAPTADSGTVYTQPILVEKNTTIAAVAFAKDLAPSPLTLASYLIDGKKGLATFHLGNSLTNCTTRFADYLGAAGIIHQYQKFSGAARMTWQFWEIDLPKRQEEWTRKLAEIARIDHFTLQPRDFTNNSVDHEAEYDIRFLEVIRKHSPQMQPWFYIEWVDRERTRPTDKAAIPSRQMKKIFPTRSWEESMSAMLLYGEDLQAKVVETYREGKRPRVLPTCVAMGWLKNIIDQGKFPGVEKGGFHAYFFADHVHPNLKGDYLVNLTWYAAFYGESPEGKIPAYGTGLTPEQAGILQKLAWDVVRNYPDCGLYEEGTSQVADPEFVAADANPEGMRAITLTSKTPGAWFRYTLDGTTPTRTCGYIYCGVITLPPGATLKAIAYKSGMGDSRVLTN